VLRTRYHKVLETGDASALVNLSSGALRRHAMEALTAYAKCYAIMYKMYFASVRGESPNVSLRL
jgi:hypothetical protein